MGFFPKCDNFVEMGIVDMRVHSESSSEYVRDSVFEIFGERDVNARRENVFIVNLILRYSSLTDRHILEQTL